MEEEEDGPLWRAVQRSLMCGGVGGAVGGLLASVRDANTVFYVSSMSTNYFAVSLTYFGVLELAKKGFPDKAGTWQMHAGVGTLVGSFFGLTFSGPRKLPQFAGGFALLGVGGFFAHTKLLEMQARLATERLKSNRATARSTQEEPK